MCVSSSLTKLNIKCRATSRFKLKVIQCLKKFARKLRNSLNKKWKVTLFKICQKYVRFVPKKNRYWLQKSPKRWFIAPSVPMAGLQSNCIEFNQTRNFIRSTTTVSKLTKQKTSDPYPNGECFRPLLQYLTRM